MPAVQVMIIAVIQECQRHYLIIPAAKDEEGGVFLHVLVIGDLVVLNH